MYVYVCVCVYVYIFKARDFDKAFFNLQGLKMNVYMYNIYIPNIVEKYWSFIISYDIFQMGNHMSLV